MYKNHRLTIWGEYFRLCSESACFPLWCFLFFDNLISLQQLHKEYLTGVASLTNSEVSIVWIHLHNREIIFCAAVVLGGLYLAILCPRRNNLRKYSSLWTRAIKSGDTDFGFSIHCSELLASLMASCSNVHINWYVQWELLNRNT